MKTNHTPGPWTLIDGGIYAKDNTLHIADIKNRGYIEANARLIAAAPELLQLVKDLNYAFYVLGTPKAMKEVMTKSKDLIAKAEGKE